MREETKDRIIPVAAIAGILAFTFGVAWIASYFEARTFNKLTGSNVTTVDALFVKLRVIRCEGNMGESP